MSTFPVTIVDNFLDDPDYVLELAKSVEYTQPGSNNYPGCKSVKKLYDIDFDLNTSIMSKLCSVFWDLNDSRVEWDGSGLDFMKIEPYSNKDSILNKGIIHHDGMAKTSIAGIVYLNKDHQRDCGTSFYEPKLEDYEQSTEFTESVRKYHGGENIPNVKELFQHHYDSYDETVRVQNKFNRLCVYTPNVWHGVTSYGENQTRYTLRIFASLINSCPLQRWKNK